MANPSIYAAFERMWQHIVAALGNKSDISHTHDDEYYTETEVDTVLAGKADAEHTHDDYALKADIPELGDLAVKDTVSKTDLEATIQASLDKADSALQSYTETDPTVPAWAKESTKPTYTAEEVGADPTGTANTAVTAHNVAADAHNDIRLLVEGLTTRLNTLADSDDTTLDQLSEIVAYIKSNKDLIDAVTTNKVNVTDIIDNLTTNASDKPLSAAQGVALKALIDAITVPTKVSELTNDSGFITSYTETDPTVPAWAKEATKPTYTAGEVGADASGTASDAVDTHNSAADAHSDIRTLITDLDTELDTKADIEAGTYVVTAETTDGAAYTATVPGITELTRGVNFIMIPAAVSTTKGPTLDVNGLGAKYIRRRLSTGATVEEGYVTTWLTKNKPFRLMYDGAQWVVEGHNRPVAADIYGPITATNDVNGNAIVDTYATKAELENYASTSDIDTHNSASDAHSDLFAAKADAEHEHSQYLTEHQDISGKVNLAGDTMTGALIAQNNANYTTKQVRNIFLMADGEDLPTGANGDVCLVYTP